MNSSNNIIYFLNKARKASLNSQVPKTRIGAILVKNGKVISTGWNKLQNNRLYGTFSQWRESIHAEVDCLLNAPYTQIPGSVLYVYREHKNGDLAMCRPCEYCMRFITHSKIKRIIYTTSDISGFREEKI